jgi:hypothetical protein
MIDYAKALEVDPHVVIDLIISQKSLKVRAKTSYFHQKIA